MTYAPATLCAKCSRIFADRIALDVHERECRGTVTPPLVPDAPGDTSPGTGGAFGFETEFDPAACPTCGEEDFHGCDGCGDCQTCCNCSETDCDCDACEERRKRDG